MRRYKNSSIRLIYIVLWSVIFLISFNLLIKCIQIFGMDSVNPSAQSKQSNVVSTACNYLMQSNLPIIDYITEQNENEDNNVILNNLAGVFPINRYVVENYNYIDDNLIKEKTDSVLFANGSNLLFNNAVSLALILNEQEKINEKSRNANLKKNQTTYNSNDNLSDYSSDNKPTTTGNDSNVMSIDIINGEVYFETDDSTNPNKNANKDSEVKQTLGSINGEHFTLDQLMNRQFLYNNFYIVDSATVVTDDLFNAEILLKKNMIMKATSEKPQILIYHTHSQEAFSDSRKGVEKDTIVGVGSYLTKILTEEYGFNVIHDKSQYDIMEGYLDRNLAYNHASAGIAKILEKNPSIEIVLDLHRDGVDFPEDKRVTKINGKDTAQIMLFNGLSRNTKGKIDYLNNPYLQDNLAFSLQMQLKGREIYPGFMYKNYLHAYRYNMHYRKKSILAEVGTNYNTVEEMMNAMDPFAVILNEVITGEP